ncbi:MAG: hypothetical protein H7Y59_06595 [Anaerolineales bacterium]|nr:hypothetical protein [Anaerolineales bacterium]
MMTDIRTQWANSKRFRILLTLALIYAVLRMAVQVIVLSDMWSASANPAEEFVAADLKVYVDAARHFSNHEDLYLQGSFENEAQSLYYLYYLYSPAFALMFMPILLLPVLILVSLDIILHIIAYALIYIYWGKIFKRLQLTGASQALVNLLPLWIVFTGFWDDVAYLNIYIIMALVGTLFINALLEEKLAWSIFWLGVIILPIKPHWAFAAALPLLLGRYKFFIRLMVGVVIAYFAVAGVTILIGGIEYGLKQYADYISFLSFVSNNYTWRGPDQPFLAYNHSLKQTVVYFLGISPTTLKLATVLKILFIAPLGYVAFRYLTHPLNKHGDEVPRLALDLTFALYLGAFLWLDMIWELSLGIAVFTYLIGTLENKKMHIFLWFIFLPYALADIWRLLSYIIFGEAVLEGGAYVLTDPLLYLPWILMVLMSFYAVIVWRLYKSQTELIAKQAV